MITLLPRPRVGRHFPSTAAVLVLWIGTATSTTARAAEPLPGEEGITHRPIQVRDDGYVSSNACQSCHPSEYASWHRSYHRSMTQLATPEAVVSPLANMQFRSHRRDYAVRERDGRYWLEMDDPKANDEQGEPLRVAREIVMTTGSHHLQTYWYATGEGRKVALFPFFWRIDEQRWIPNTAAFVQPPMPPGYQDPLVEKARWSIACSKCHSTHRKARIGDSGEVDTVVAEFGIACEACHGPGEDHVAANHEPGRRYRLHWTDAADPTIVNPARLSPARASDVCGQCHGVTTAKTPGSHDRENVHGFAFRPGEVLADSRAIVRNREGHRPPDFLRHDEANYMDSRFWSDAMPRVSGREYTGLLESACNRRGTLSCLSCHEMHPDEDDPRSLDEWAPSQLSRRALDDEACTQCHPGVGDDTEQLEAHTRHLATGSGSRCVNCHMPYTSFGLMKAARSHTIDSPSVQSFLDTGRPTACSLCHLDRPLGWVADRLSKRGDAPRPALDAEHEEIATGVLLATRGDAGQRALVAWAMGWEPARESSGSNWMIPYLAQLLLDPYEAVRFVAHRSLRERPGLSRLEYDFLGPRKDRQQVRDELMALWTRQAPPQPVSGSRLLLDENGHLQVQRFNELLSRRDNRYVRIEE